jgi:hypothetical protein
LIVNIQNLFELRNRATITATAEKRESLRDWALVNAITSEILTRITAGEGSGLRWVLWVNWIKDPESWGRDYYDLFRLVRVEEVMMSIPAPILAPEAQDGLLALEPVVAWRTTAVVALAGARSYKELIERDPEPVAPRPQAENVLDLWAEFLPLITDRTFSNLSPYHAEKARKKLEKMERKLHHRALLSIAA